MTAQGWIEEHLIVGSVLPLLHLSAEFTFSMQFAMCVCVCPCMCVELVYVTFCTCTHLCVFLSRLQTVISIRACSALQWFQPFPAAHSLQIISSCVILDHWLSLGRVWVADYSSSCPWDVTLMYHLADDFIQSFLQGHCTHFEHGWSQ